MKAMSKELYELIWMALDQAGSDAKKMMQHYTEVMVDQAIKSRPTGETRLSAEYYLKYREKANMYQMVITKLEEIEDETHQP